MELSLGTVVHPVISPNTNNIAVENDSLFLTSSYEDLLDMVDAVFIISHPSKHYEHIKKALTEGKHVLCESPFALKEEECEELEKLALNNNLIFELSVILSLDCYG